MKKLLCTMPCALWMGLVLLFVTACSDDDNNTRQIEIADESELEQTLSGDQQTSTLSFVAASDWTSTVSETTPTTKSADSWLKLDPDHGGAGSYTINIILEPNETGETRSAVITISCGGTQITVSVTQEATSGSVTPSDRYFVERVNILNEEVYSTGETHKNEDIYFFEYDEKGRVTLVRTEDPEADGTNEITYGDGTVTIYTTGEDGYEETSVFTLNEDGYVKSFSRKESSGESVEGTIVYDENGYVKSGTRIVRSGSENEYTDTAEWEDGNLVKACMGSSVGEPDKTTAVMKYNNPDYVNTPTINLDLNYLICSTEWLDCLMMDGLYLQPFGYMGKRSALYMTEERDMYSGDYYTYTYDYDELGRPVTIHKVRHTDDTYYVSEEYTYTITYKN
ncbi:DUF4595 domain-containing protein [Phocaeicola coprophilus]|nr:DUF4595 domain-containing protein [Phocaeicola coprophilus]